MFLSVGLHLAQGKARFADIVQAVEQNMAETATQQDLSRLLQPLQVRDERIVLVETELRRVTEDYRRLREELLPVFKMAKDRHQPLPPPDGHNYDGQQAAALASPSHFNPPTSGSISRTFSKRIYTGGNTPTKTGSPTFYQHDGRAYDNSFDPAASVSNSGATAQQSPVMPSPTSPHQPQQALSSRAYNQQPNSRHDDDRQLQRSDTRVESRAASGGEPSVEIFKSFRVSLEDPCYRVLPAALKKYNINGDWRQYALYIVHGDQERCLMLDERPLILFKQLEKDGRKPMFMLRKQMHPVDSSSTYAGASSTNSSIVDGARPPQGQINLPGGVL